MLFKDEYTLKKQFCCNHGKGSPWAVNSYACLSLPGTGVGRCGHYCPPPCKLLNSPCWGWTCSLGLLHFALRSCFPWVDYAGTRTEGCDCSYSIPFRHSLPEHGLYVSTFPSFWVNFTTLLKQYKCLRESVWISIALWPSVTEDNAVIFPHLCTVSYVKE